MHVMAATCYGKTVPSQALLTCDYKLEPRSPHAFHCWTQKRLAQVAGISLSTIRAIEQGKPTTAIGNYLAILWALDLDAQLDNLLGPRSTGAITIAMPKLDNNF